MNPVVKQFDQLIKRRFLSNIINYFIGCAADDHKHNLLRHSHSFLIQLLSLKSLFTILPVPVELFNANKLRHIQSILLLPGIFHTPAQKQQVFHILRLPRTLCTPSLPKPPPTKHHRCI